jgi:hypothetical protein
MLRTKGRFTRIGVALALCSGMWALGAPSASATGAIATSVHFADLNYCGINSHVKMNTFEPWCPSDHSAVVTELNDMSSLPSALTLQEVCLSQVQTIMADVVSGGSPWFTAYGFAERYSQPSPNTHGFACPAASGDPTDPYAFGNAVLTHHALSGWTCQGIHTDGSPPTDDCALEQDETARSMSTGCGESYALDGTTKVYYWVCSTHLPDTPADAEADVPTMINWAYPLASLKNNAMYLGGDFNLDPSDSALDDIYATCSSSKCGQFQEMYGIHSSVSCPHSVDIRTNPIGTAYGDVDSSQGCNPVSHLSNAGASSLYRKIDYMFFKQSYAQNFLPAGPWGREWGQTMSSWPSDHDLLYGAVDICANSGCS